VHGLSVAVSVVVVAVALCEDHHLGHPLLQVSEVARRWSRPFWAMEVMKMPRLSLQAIDNLLESPMRFAILCILYISRAKTYSDLLDAMKQENEDISSGNFSAHLYRLENAGLVRAKRALFRRKVKATYVITRKGEHALRTALSKRLAQDLRVAKDLGIPTDLGIPVVEQTHRLQPKPPS